MLSEVNGQIGWNHWYKSSSEESSSNTNENDWPGKNIIQNSKYSKLWKFKVVHP